MIDVSVIMVSLVSLAAQPDSELPSTTTRRNVPASA